MTNFIDISKRIADLEQGYLDHEEVVDLYQELLESGMIYHLQGSHQRAAYDLYVAGEIQ